MKVTVNKYLNARVGEASTNASCQFYRSPGDTIEIDNVLIGTEIDGNSIWYKCNEDGCYYWSGGIEEIAFELSTLKISKLLLIAVLKDLQKRKYVEFLNSIEGFTGCGIGYKNYNKYGELVIAFFVKQKGGNVDITRQVPKFIIYKGFRIMTDVVEMKSGVLQYVPNPPLLVPDPDKHIPGAIGGKIYQSGFPGFFGTASLKVLKDQRPMLLGCCHVMAFEKFRNTLTVTRISGAEGYTLDIFDTLTGRVRKLKVLEGVFDGSIDYALAELPNNDFITNHVNGKLIEKFATEGDIELLWLDKVQAVGRVSRLQEGIILHTSSQITFSNANEAITFKNIIITEKLSTGGDSGAPVVKNNIFIGYVFGGDDQKFSYIIPFYKLNKFCSIIN
jgi:hypothetical protein